MSDGLKSPKFPFKTCFVITPYGTKTGSDNTIHDFEYVFENIVTRALSGLVAYTNRSKDRLHSGVVHEDMFRQIISADVVICDITTMNPNVMYELGVRHAARPSGTILIHQEGTHADGFQLPFNLRPVRVMTYKVPRRVATMGKEAGAVHHSQEQSAQADEALLKESRDQLAGLVEKSLQDRKVDSPVHALIRNLNLIVPPRELDTVAVGSFPLDPAESVERTEDAASAPDQEAAGEGVLQRSLEEQPLGSTVKKTRQARRRRRLCASRIGIATGNLRDLYDVADVWLNPENTRMEMGPMFGETVSSYVRVLGSTSQDDSLGRDEVQRQLRRAMNGASSILPSRTITTKAGALAKTHGVRRILHVAAQEGFPLSGFSTVKRPGLCVERALEEVERLNGFLNRRFGYDPPLRSVLIPLFGTRNPNSDPVDVTKEIIQAAKRHLDLEHGSKLERVLFLASTDQDLELCETAFRRLGYAVEDIAWEVHSFGERMHRD